ncbi:MAG: heme ABC exporter ATP-binding protein CcmA [Candidatus Dormiibacterota bacterium]
MTAVLGRGLVQRYGARRALGPLDLDVDEGERLAVLGDNGAGKSTLLRILATLARPAAGSLELLGHDALRRREALRPRLGYLGHEPGLTPMLNARENLEFFCRLHGLPRERALVALETVGLQGAAGVLAHDLSRGMQQRLALARAVLARPDLLILDEPDASLDQSGRGLLDELCRGRTVVLATHDRALARRVCERALLLRDGRAGGDPWQFHVVLGGGGES